MDNKVKEIFRDAGASETELEAIDQLSLVAAQGAREAVLVCADMLRPELRPALRMLFARVIHADMERAIASYRTGGEYPCSGSLPH